jgi:hypothetical protein
MVNKLGNSARKSRNKIAWEQDLLGQEAVAIQKQS